MPDQLQQPMSPPLPPASIGVQKSDTREVIGEEQIDPIAEELARQELARISPSRAELERFVAKCGPLPKWLDEDEPSPF